MQNLWCADSCEPWPSDLKTIKECCNFPPRRITVSENSCFRQCSENNPEQDIYSQMLTEEDNSKLKACMELCFMTQSTLVDSDMKLNKESVKHLYQHQVHIYGEANWDDVLDNATESCKMESNGSLSEILAQYFICIEDYLANNCVEFSYLDQACGAVEERFLKCKNIQFDCNNFPIALPDQRTCCKFPTLMTYENLFTCRDKCELTEYFFDFFVDCIRSCLHDEVKIFVDGKIPEEVDHEKVKKLLVENSKNKNVDWTNVIDESIKKCVSEIESSKHFMLDFHNCIAGIMSERCLDYSTGDHCVRTRQFFEQCGEKALQQHD